MGLRCRRILAYSAAVCWTGVTILCTAGVLAGWGYTPETGRFFAVLLSAAAVLTITAVIGYAITPAAAGQGIGIRAAMRAGRDGASQCRQPGRHAKDDSSGARVIELFQLRRLMAAVFWSA